MIVTGTNIIFNGTRFEKGQEWLMYPDIGKAINKATKPLKAWVKDFNPAKLDDLDTLIWQNKNPVDGVYYAHMILRPQNKYREDMIDLILNVIYPKTKNVMYLKYHVFYRFLEYAEENKFSSKERITALEQFLDGKPLEEIKFEKIDNTETETLVREVMKSVNLDELRRKPTLVNYYVGQVMKLSKGKAPVATVKTLIEEML
jgi:hypothetical protein